MKKKTTEEFILESKLKFADKFYYNKTIYIDALSKVIITCKVHGDFYIRPNDHLHGKGGCKICVNRKEHTKESFIKKATEVHNNYYDYSNVVFETSNKDVIIACPVHGNFLQKPRNHMYGSGCLKCGVIKSNLQQTKTLDVFIDESNVIHDNKYDYSKAVYNNNATPVLIKCPIHGEFFQTPYTHLRGSGCPECALTLKAENYRNIKTYLYYVKFKNNIYKIGLARKSIASRFKGCKKPDVLCLYEFFDGYDAFKAERLIIKMNAIVRYKGNNFISNNANVSCGETECFTSDIIEKINETLSTSFKDKYITIKGN